MYTRERLLEEYNKYLLDDDIYDKDVLILKNRQFLLDLCFPLPSKGELEFADNKLKEVLKDLHKRTINLYEYLKPILGESWSIESVYYPIFERETEEDLIIETLGTDYNPMMRFSTSYTLDSIGSKGIDDLYKTDLQLFQLEDENDSWGDYDLPNKIRGTYSGLHISGQLSGFRTRYYSFSDIVKIKGYNTEIIFSDHVKKRNI